jgi:hypothetical protein
MHDGADFGRRVIGRSATLEVGAEGVKTSLKGHLISPGAARKPAAASEVIDPRIGVYPAFVEIIYMHIK